MRFFVHLKRVVLYAIPVLVMVAVVMLFRRMNAHRTLTDSDYARDHGAPLPVRVYRVETAPLSPSVPAECSAQPNPLIEVRGLLTRPVTKTHVHLGEHVKKGAILVSLDDSPERLEISRATAMITAYEKVVHASEDLVGYYRSVRDQGLGLERDLKVAAVDLAKTQADLAQAETDLKTAKASLQNTRVVAPESGAIMAVAQPGEEPVQGSSLATIAAIDPIRLECLLPEEKLPFVAPGMAIRASFYSRPGESYNGVVQHVDALTKEKDRTITVRAEIQNKDGVLLPGLHGIAEIQNEKRTPRIPSVALVNPRSDIAQVFVVDAQDKAKLKKISVGGSAGGYVQVLDGLATGDRVVVAGQLGLRDGDSTRVTEDKPLGTTP